MEDYIIWNEPNNWPDGLQEPDLDPEHFAALLYHAWNEMVDAPRMYWGGIHFGPGHHDQPDGSSLDYIASVYQALLDHARAGGEYGGWPWSGINIHFHGDRGEWTEAHIANLFNALRALMGAKGDSGSILVGEWGFQLGSSPDMMSRVFNSMKPNAYVMFYFSHHYVDDSGLWGLRYYDIQPGQYVLEGETDLYGPYDTLVGT